MPSPFPGMDPYLETAWSDVHAKLIAYIAEPLSEQLPPGLRVISEEDLSIASAGDDDPRALRPDVVVTAAPVTAPKTAPVGVIVPDSRRSLRVHLVREPRADKRVLIVDSQAGGRVVTAIEVLSPGNKDAGPGNRKYLRKLQTYRSGGVNIVEIDLLRHPNRDHLEVNQSHLYAEFNTPYLACIARAGEPDDWDVVAIPLRERVPPIPVPLRAFDPDASLELQPILDRIYRVGHYADVIDYAKPPQPPLSGPDAEWASALLAGASRPQ